MAEEPERAPECPLHLASPPIRDGHRQPGNLTFEVPKATGADDQKCLCFFPSLLSGLFFHYLQSLQQHSGGPAGSRAGLLSQENNTLGPHSCILHVSPDKTIWGSPVKVMIF